MTVLPLHQTYTCTGTVTRSATTTTRSPGPREAVLEFVRTHGVTPEAVEWAGRRVEVVDLCVWCEAPILDGDDWEPEICGGVACRGCAEAVKSCP